MTDPKRPDSEHENPSPPGDTICDIMDEQDISRRSLCKSLDISEEALTNLLEGKYKVDNNMAHKLSEALGSTTEFWENREKHYRDALTSTTTPYPEQKLQIRILLQEIKKREFKPYTNHHKKAVWFTDIEEIIKAQLPHQLPAVNSLLKMPTSDELEHGLNCFGVFQKCHRKDCEYKLICKYIAEVASKARAEGVAAENKRILDELYSLAEDMILDGQQMINGDPIEKLYGKGKFTASSVFQMRIESLRQADKGDEQG